MHRINAYLRRRAWGVWHTAALGRYPVKMALPSLDELQGRGASNAPERAVESTGHNLRHWKKLLEAQFAPPTDQGIGTTSAPQ